MKSVVFVVAPADFRDEELFHTQEELTSKGITTVVASLKSGVCKGRKGRDAVASLEMKNVHAKDFDGIVFVGGGGVIEYKLHENPEILRAAQEFEIAGKVVAAICIAPRILVNADLIKGRRATTYSDQINIEGIKKQGIYSQNHVEADGTLVTADGPLAARDFGKAIVEKLEKIND